MTRYSLEPGTKKYVKVYGFLSFGRSLSTKYRKQLLDAATKTGLDALKTTSKKVRHKAAEATGEFIGNKIANKFVKPKPVPEAHSKNIEKIFIPSEEREEILNKLIQVLQKWNTIRYLN